MWSPGGISLIVCRSTHADLTCKLRYLHAANWRSVKELHTQTVAIQTAARGYVILRRTCLASLSMLCVEHEE
jgi:carbamoylphosphate synthase small subunit